jgi:hypothetical protein
MGLLDSIEKLAEKGAGVTDKSNDDSVSADGTSVIITDSSSSASKMDDDSDTQKNDQNIQKIRNEKDIQFTNVATPDRTTFLKYLSAHRLANLNNYVDTILAKDNGICPLIMLSICRTVTNDLQDVSFTRNGNFGTFPTDAEHQYTDVNDSIRKMIQDMKSVSSESPYLSYLRFQYIKKPVKASSANKHYGLYKENIDEYKIEFLDSSDKSYNDSLDNQQVAWFNKVKEYLNEAYKEIIGGEPVYEERDIGKSNSSNKAPKPNATNTASADGVKKKPGGHHKTSESHEDTIVIKLPENKTYAEPVYPDLLTVADAVPVYTKKTSTISSSLKNSIFDISTDSDSTSKVSSSMTTPDGVKVEVKTTSSSENKNTPASDISESGTTSNTGLTPEQQAAANAVKIVPIVNTPLKTNEVDSQSGDTISSEQTKIGNAKTTDTSSQTKTDQSSSASSNSSGQKQTVVPYAAPKPLSGNGGASPLSALNNALYNTMNSIIGSSNDSLARQIAYDPTKHKNTFKQPTKGKPANNSDPFPTDLKIEELELHFPHEYIHNVKCCPQSLTVGEALVKLASASEKRTVKLENNMATLMRYFFALANRMHINCVYYGGTSQYTKYRSIRCLKDNRLEDADQVSIDQCLSCTRFEPVYGMCYELINEKGANLAQILDDNQMSYSNMHEYAKFVHTGKYSEQLTDYQTGASSVTIRNPEDAKSDFDTLYKDKGIKMNWKLVPVEEQKPHIGWRQSINDDGSYLKSHKLASYQYSAENSGQSFGSVKKSVWIENKEAMDANSDSTLSQLIAAGQSSSLDLDETVNGMKAKDYAKQLGTQKSNAGITLDTAACIVLCVKYGKEFSDISSNIKAIESALSAQNINNQIITVTCFGISPNDTKGTDYFIGANKISSSTNKKDNASSSSGSKSSLDWNNVNNWKWTDFAPYLVNLNISGLDLTPIVAYRYTTMQKYASDAISGIRQFMDSYDGSPMDNGTSGCCEAVTKIGATYSEFLKQELAKGIVYCPTLEEDAKAAGVPVIDFDTSQLEAGDVIMYTEQHHVVIYSGEGDRVCWK